MAGVDLNGEKRSLFPSGAMVPRLCEPILVPNMRRRQSDPLRNAEILTDVHLKKWRLGKAIGEGAFGEIFLASEDLYRPVGSDTKFVIKMEPFMSGPLFVERNFYLRAANSTKLDEYKKRRSWKHLGVPRIYAFGTHVLKGTKMRFIVMPKYCECVENVFIKFSNKFHVKTVFTLARNILDSLEFVHDQGFIHSDIKGRNLVLSREEGDCPKAPVYLIDFGLAAKFLNNDGSHKACTPDSRKANAGTLEFSSRDAHDGVVTRRSDLESLGFNIVRWLGCRLPWEDVTNPELVAEAKRHAMSDVKRFLSEVFQSEEPPCGLYQFLLYVFYLESDAKPDYEYIRSLFERAIVLSGYANDLKLTFTSHAKLTKKAALKRKRCMSDTENIPLPTKIVKRVVVGQRTPCTDINRVVVRVTRNCGKKKRRKFDWARVLAGNPEDFFKKSKQSPQMKQDVACDVNKTLRRSAVDLSNPTPAMLRILNKKKQRSSSLAKQHRSDHSTPAGVTYAMAEVMASRLPTKRVLRSSARLASMPHG